MTAYFDTARREISDAPRDTEGFMQVLCAVEARVKKDVIDCAGDPEFPLDLRSKITKVIRAEQVQDSLGAIHSENASMAVAMRYSELIEDLHSIFHELASRRQKTRFTVWWSDDPAGNMRLLEAWKKDPS